MPRRIVVDTQDLAQERAIALWLGTDPREAVKSYLRQEHRFYDAILPEFYLEDNYDAPSGRKFATAPMVIIRPNRSKESIEQRKAYTREWWRKNGREYRRKRKGTVTT